MTISAARGPPLPLGRGPSVTEMTAGTFAIGLVMANSAAKTLVTKAKSKRMGWV